MIIDRTTKAAAGLKIARKYDMIRTIPAMLKALSLCSGPTALDFETTALSPTAGRERLVQLCNDRVWCVIDLDGKGMRDAFFDEAEEGGPWIVFHAGFEYRWFKSQDTDPMLVDVGNLRRARMGGGRFKLMQMAAWDLGYDMPKEEQASNWGEPLLSGSQIDYAADDALITHELYKHWCEKTTARHDEAAELLDAMVPAVVEMEDTGMLLDTRVHKRLVRKWVREIAVLEAKIRTHISPDQVANLRSNPQCSDFFGQIFPDNVLRHWPKTEKSGQLQITGDTLRLFAGFYRGTPIEEALDSLSDYRTISQYLSFFGDTLLNKAAQDDDKRIRARFNIGAAKTLRFSCSGPNLQQIPRSRQLLQSHVEATEVRRSFTAPEGSALVSFDYSAIELRVLALLSGDETLLHDVVFGDLHGTVAEFIQGRAIDKKIPEDKEHRANAKPVSFGIIYGASPSGLSLTMRCALSKAEEIHSFWSERYAVAFDYRYKMEAEAKQTGFLPMIDGGTIYLGQRADLPKCANYPVQRAALSVMARAIIRHKNTLDRLRKQGKVDPDLTKMLASVHDALIDEAKLEDAPLVRSAMKKDMELGFLDYFPDASIHGLLEGGQGPNWAELD